MKTVPPCELIEVVPPRVVLIRRIDIVLVFIDRLSCDLRRLLDLNAFSGDFDLRVLLNLEDLIIADLLRDPVSLLS